MGFDDFIHGGNGGTKAKLLVEKAKNERRQRELMRRAETEKQEQIEAACRIVSFWRSRKSKRLCRQLLREEWDAKALYVGLENQPSIPSPAAPGCEAAQFQTPVDYLQATGLLVRFYEAHADAPRLGHLCGKILLKCKLNPFKSLLSTSNRSATASSVLTKFLWMCVQRVSGQVKPEAPSGTKGSSPVTWSSDNLYLMGPELRLLLLWLDSKHYPPTSAPVLRDVQSRLLELGLFSSLSEPIFARTKVGLSIRSHKKNDAQDERRLKSIGLWLNAVLRISLMLLETDTELVPPFDNTKPAPSAAEVSKDLEPRMLLFFVHVLSSPVLVSFLDNQGIEMLNRAKILERFISSLHVNEQQRRIIFNTLEGEEMLFLVGNLVDLFRRIEDISKLSVTSSDGGDRVSSSFLPLVSVLSEFLVHCRQYISDKATNVVSYHPFFKWYSGKSNSSLTPFHFAILTNQLNALSSSALLNRAFKPVLSFDIANMEGHGSGSAWQRRITLLSLEIRDICQFYLVLVGTITTQRAAILNRLSYLPELIPKLWRFMNELGPKGVGTEIFLNAAKDGPDKEHLMPILELFSETLEIFRILVDQDKITNNTGTVYPITVNRKRVLEDGFSQLSRVNIGSATIRVTYINEFGLVEAGIDQMGVFKEFLEDLCKAAFSAHLNLFRSTPAGDGTVLPSPTSNIHANHLALFEFVGKILGKALYEGIVIDIPFALFVYTKLLGRYNFLDELPTMDPELYKNLTFLKHYEGDCEDLGLNFTIDTDVFGEVVTKDIKPGGQAIAVTNENKYEYIYLMADYRLNQECKEQFQAFIRGFRSVISKNWLQIFSPSELQRLMSGENGDFDVQDLRKHVKYEGGFFDQHRTIRHFWQVIEEMDTKNRTAFLKFVTSCSKPPVGGFQHLHPPLTIRCIGEDPTEEQPAHNTDRNLDFGNRLFSLFGAGGNASSATARSSASSSAANATSNDSTDSPSSSSRFSFLGSQRRNSQPQPTSSSSSPSASPPPSSAPSSSSRRSSATRVNGGGRGSDVQSLGRALGNMLTLGLGGAGGPDVKRLPTASTCFNLLKLPAYKKKSTLREKLKYAINSGAGFELA